MATRPDIPTAVVNRLSSDNQFNIFFAIKAEFDTDDINVWSGTDDLTIGSDTYIGAGNLISLEQVRDSTEVKSEGLVIHVSSLTPEIITMATTENYVNRNITLLMGYLSGGSNEVAGTMTLFKGRMKNLTINDNPTDFSVTITCENRLDDLSRPSNIRYTSESQNFVLEDSSVSTDNFYSWVEQIQDKQILWGRTTTSGSGGGGTGCFVAGSQVLMSDDTLINVENVGVAQKIASYNFDDNIREDSLVQDIDEKEVGATMVLKWKKAFFKKGRLECSLDHPVYVDGKGWCSMDPELTKKYHGLEVQHIKEGDYVWTRFGQAVKLEEIEIKKHEKPIKVYNITKVAGNCNYFVNDILVHNKGGFDDTQHAIMRR